MVLTQVEHSQCSCCSSLTPWFERCESLMLCPVCSDAHCTDNQHLSCQVCNSELDIVNDYWTCNSCEQFSLIDRGEKMNEKTRNFALKSGVTRAKSCEVEIDALFRFIQKHELWDALPPDTKQRYRDAEQLLDDIQEYFSGVAAGRSVDEITEDI